MDFVEIIKAVFIGFIQGVTEWLPVSSTGHMIIAEEFVNLKISVDVDSENQLPSILADENLLKQLYFMLYLQT